MSRWFKESLDSRETLNNSVLNDPLGFTTYKGSSWSSGLMFCCVCWVQSSQVCKLQVLTVQDRAELDCALAECLGHQDCDCVWDCVSDCPCCKWLYSVDSTLAANRIFSFSVMRLSGLSDCGKELIVLSWGLKAECRKSSSSSQSSASERR